jgi:protein ImuB
VVVASSREARTWPGTPLSEAAGRVDGLLVREHDAGRTERGLASLARWAYQTFSPRVACDGDGLLIDIAGSERLHGGEEQILALAARLPRPIEARFALADVPCLATALARFGEEEGAVVPAGLSPEEHRAVASPLDLRCLCLEAKIQRRLDALGVETVGEALRLPRGSVPARLGDRILRRLDELVGVRPTAPSWLDFEAPLGCRVVFEEPGTFRCEDVLVAAERACAELFAGLRERDEALSLLTLELEDEAAHREEAPKRYVFRFASPTTSAACVQRVVAERLERAELGLSPSQLAVALQAHATETERLHGEQLDLFGDRERSVIEREVSELLMRLELRLGSQRVICLRPVPDARPERSARALPAAEHLLREPEVAAFPSPRPLRLFPEPIPLRVSLEGGAPARLYEGGRPWIVEESCAHERLEAGWWEPGVRSRRDYVIVRTALGAAWVFRDLDEDVFYLHGYFA